MTASSPRRVSGSSRTRPIGSSGEQRDELVVFEPKAGLEVWLESVLKWRTGASVPRIAQRVEFGVPCGAHLLRADLAWLVGRIPRGSAVPCVRPRGSTVRVLSEQTSHGHGPVPIQQTGAQDNAQRATRTGDIHKRRGER